MQQLSEPRLKHGISCFAANDGDSVIIVNVQKGEKQESSK